MKQHQEAGHNTAQEAVTEILTEAAHSIVEALPTPPITELSRLHTMATAKIPLPPLSKSRAVDIDQRHQQLCKQLQAAVELELTTLPPYLTAYFSIVEQTNSAAVALIRSVAMEEMLHLCLVGNVLVALGAQVKLGPENVPRYPHVMAFQGQGLRKRDFAISLEKFSPSSLKTFRRIELPDDLPPLDLSLPKPGNDMALDAYSIGEFYQEIIDSLTALDDDYRSAGRTLFSTDTSQQIGETYFWHGGGKPVVVTDIASAKRALNIIIEQGEGASGGFYDGDSASDDRSADLSHYFKFSELYYQQRYRADDNPALPPTGPALELDYNAVYSIKTNPVHSDYADNVELANLNIRFNETYSLMLQQIEEAFSGNPKALYNGIMNGMHDLTSIARTMMKIEIDPEQSPETGAPTYEWITPVSAVTEKT